MRGNGERIGPQNLPTSSIAGGIWNLLNQQRAQQRGAWPSATPAVVTDPYFMYVPLLLNTTSTNGQQNNTFLDSSSNAFTITRNGTPTQGAFTPYQPSGYWSGYFNGTSDSLSLATSTAFGFGTGDYTIETWIYSPSPATGTIQTIVDLRNTTGPSPVQINLSTTGYPGAYNGTAYTSSVAVVASTWNHIALVRNGSGTNNCKLYLNGTQTAQFTDTSDYGSTHTCFIARNAFSAVEYFNGYMSNLRIVKGTAVYTSAFTPPTTPLTAITNTSLLTLQSNRFIDNSSNAFAITVNGTPKVQAFQPFAPAASYSAATYGGSGYFGGSDYLQTPSNSAVSAWSTDFTIESYIYLTSLASTTHWWTNSTSNSDGFTACYIKTDGAIAIGRVGLNESASAAGVIKLNQWQHLAVVRNSSSVTIYVNGVSVATPTTTNLETTTTKPLTIGGQFQTSGNSNWNGYISNFRVVKGTAVYTANFTPPPAPVTAITNTSLLTNFTNAGIYDAAWQNNALTVGDAQASTTITAKWPPTSMKFDGTGDYLTVPNTQSFAFGSGNWTIEAWVYLTANPSGSSAAYLTDFRGSNASNYTFGFIGSGGVTKMYAYSSPNGDVTGSQTVSLNAWNYVAYVRNGSTITIYLNGTSNGTLTTTYTQSASTVNIGSNSSGTETVTGYIQDLRITKGVARTITTPTAAFPTR